MTQLNHVTKLCTTVLLLCSLFVPVISAGQQTTERFIPIGQSPGISGEYSYIGTIVAVDRAAKTITVQSNRGNKTIRIGAETRIWLDRSRLKLTNLDATFDDCEVRRRVEVMYDHDDHGLADWVKVEAS